MTGRYFDCDHVFLKDLFIYILTVVFSYVHLQWVLMFIIDAITPLVHQIYYCSDGSFVGNLLDCIIYYAWLKDI